MAGASESSKPIGITPWNAKFHLSEALNTSWHRGSIATTTVFNAISLMFPVGERFFIDTVQEFSSDVIDPELKMQMKAFCQQESNHARQHHRYNEAVCDSAGVSLEAIERPVRSRIAGVQRNFPKMNRLASTVAYEHLTAVLADQILQDPTWLDGAHPQVSALWRWHAIEEAEHKAVAFDVYVACGGDYPLRVKLMRFVIVFFFIDLVRNIFHLLKNSGRFKFSMWLEIFRFLFGSNGLFVSLRPGLSRFFCKDFHPWQHDNREILNSVKNSLTLQLSLKESSLDQAY
jgi:predicted metal-dependent hydrolase